MSEMHTVNPKDQPTPPPLGVEWKKQLVEEMSGHENMLGEIAINAMGVSHLLDSDHDLDERDRENLSKMLYLFYGTASQIQGDVRNAIGWLTKEWGLEE